MPRKKEIWCPVRDVLEVIEGKWTIHIIIELMSGTKRHSVLSKALDGINPKTLTDRLRDLERAGVVNRKMYEEIPPRVEYSLTPRGRQLTKLIQSLKEIGMTWQKVSKRESSRFEMCEHCHTVHIQEDGDGNHFGSDSNGEELATRIGKIARITKK